MSIKGHLYKGHGLPKNIVFYKKIIVLNQFV